MRVGILTFHFAYNYGAMLQAYALNHCLNSMDNVSCEIVDYRPRHIDYVYHPLPGDLFRHPNILVSNLKKKISHAKFDKFEKFIKSEFVLSNRIGNNKEFQTIVNQYDLVIVGSDQVWNSNITGEDKNYLLHNISPKVKKVSFAASVGVSTITKEWQECLKNNLLLFDIVSVRERSGYNLLKNILPEKVHQIPDPIFLFSKSEWKKRENEVTHKGKFILFYSLSRSDILKNKVKILSERTGVRIVSIHPFYKAGVIGEELCNIGPQNFLWLIDHAEWICTDSFHATAFSVIFEKKLVVKYDAENGNRITSLLDSFRDMIVKSDNVIGEYSFSDTSSRIKKLEMKGKAFINKCLGEDYE